MGGFIGILLIPLIYFATVGFFSGQLVGRGITGVLQEQIKSIQLVTLSKINSGWSLAIAGGGLAGSAFLTIVLFFLIKMTWSIAFFIAGLLFGVVAALVGWRIMNNQIKNIEEEENSS